MHSSQKVLTRGGSPLTHVALVSLPPSCCLGARDLLVLLYRPLPGGCENPCASVWPFRNLARCDGWGSVAGNPSLGLRKGRACLARKLRGGRWGPRAPTHLLEAPAVGHGGHHLCKLLLLALQHAVHVLGGDLQAERRRGGHPRERQAHLSAPQLLLSPPTPHTPRRRGGGGHVLSTYYVPGTRPAGSLNPPHTLGVMGFSQRLRGGLTRPRSPS